MPPGVGSRRLLDDTLGSDRTVAVIERRGHAELEPILSHYRVVLREPRSEISVADGDHLGWVEYVIFRGQRLIIWIRVEGTTSA